MILPFHLRRIESVHPVTALLFPGREAAPIIEFVAELGTAVNLYPLANGFLLCSAVPLVQRAPGALRLRELAAHLYIPADADLLPGLLDEEARALVRERGLVFLPGGTVLGYDRCATVTLAELVRVGPLRRGAWRPLPQGTRLTERIHVILDDRPPPTPELIFQEEAGDPGSAGPLRPQAPPLGRSILGNLQAGLGRLFLWLGQSLHWNGLRDAGAGLVRDGMRNDPRITENLLGRQEAALRELLREFREGDLEEALRHALPLNASPLRGETTPGDANLPTHAQGLSLADLLSRGGGGASRVWYTSDELHAQLAEEYHRAAHAAASAGDFRRAAFIYGKLLGNLRLAAEMLERGQFHAEAAIVFLEGCADERAAARCFEAAGDLDRALRLYRKNRWHIEAGDLLRRAGDDAAALDEYQAAAEELSRHGWHEAGDFLRDHVQRPDLAVRYYQLGWEGRPSAAATSCVLRLFAYHVLTRDTESLLALARSAADHYATTGAESEAVLVYGTMARLGEQLPVPAEREEIRDRALTGLARRLRQRAVVDHRPGSTVSYLLGRDGAWPAEVVADAEIAFGGAVRARKPVMADTPHTVVPLGRTDVSAVAFGDDVVFVGFENGDTVRVRLSTGAVAPLRPERRHAPVEAIACAEHGALVLAAGHVDRYGLLGTAMFDFRSQAGFQPELAGPLRLSNSLDSGMVLLWSPSRTWWYTDVPRVAHHFDYEADRPTTATALVTLANEVTLYLRFSFGSVHAIDYRHASQPGSEIDIEGQVPPPEGRQVLVEVRAVPTSVGMPELTILGINDTGHIWNVDLRWINARLHRLGSWHTRTGNYLCAALLDASNVVGILPDGVTWLHRDGHALVPRAQSHLPLHDAVAVFYDAMSHEVLIVRRRGDLVRLPRAG